MKLIISKESIKAFRPLSSEIPEDRILFCIKEAHQYDLKQLLGDALWVDFLLRFDDSGDSKYTAYQELLNGKTYTTGSISISHPGLIPFMCYKSLARFYNNNQINAVKYGLVRKIAEQSESLDSATIQSAIAELRSNALAEQADIIKFLSNNGTTYPLYAYQDGSALGQTGVKFFDPDSGTRSGNGRTLTSY